MELTKAIMGPQNGATYDSPGYQRRLPGGSDASVPCRMLSLPQSTMYVRGEKKQEGRGATPTEVRRMPKYSPDRASIFGK